MADFDVKLPQLTMTASELDRIQREINNISQQVGSVMSSVRSSIRINLKLSQSKKNLCASLDNCASDMNQMSKAIREAVQYYMGHEKNVSQKTFGKPVKVSSRTTKSKEKTNWEKFKEGVTKAVVGTTKAVKRGVKQITGGVKKVAKTLWNEVKKGTAEIWKDFKEDFKSAINYIKENYNNHGFVYKVAQYGKAAISIIGCVAVSVTAIASIFGTGGLSTPAAIASIIYSVNGIANSVTDIVNVSSGEYEKVGKTNYLKTGLTESAGWVGKQLGNEQIGEAVGTGIYYAGSLYTTFANLSNALDKAKQVDSVKLSDAYNSAKKLGAEKFSVKEIMNTDIGKLKLDYALMKNTKEYKALFDFGKNVSVYAGTFKKVADFGFDISDAGIEVAEVATGAEISSNTLDAYKDKTDGNAISDVCGAHDDAENIWETFKNMYKSDMIIRRKATP